MGGKCPHFLFTWRSSQPGWFPWFRCTFPAWLGTQWDRGGACWRCRRLLPHSLCAHRGFLGKETKNYSVMQSNKTKSHCTRSITLKEGQIIKLTPLRSSGNKLKAVEFNIESTNLFLSLEKSYSIHSKKDIMTYTLQRIIIIKSYCPCTNLTSPHPPCHRGWVWRGA